MGKEIPQLTALLHKRLRAFQLLSHEIAAGQAACVALDLDALRTCDERKLGACGDLQELSRALAELGRDPACQALLQSLRGGAAGSGAPEELRRAWAESEKARSEACQRNAVYAELLRRARATGSVMMNVIAHCLGVYPSEAFPGQSQFERSV